MATINLFAKENATSSFIQDVLSSVDYPVDTFREIPTAGAIPQVPLVIWDLDSFSAHNLEMLKALRKKTPDTLILVYAEAPEQFGEISNKLYGVWPEVRGIRG